MVGNILSALERLMSEPDDVCVCVVCVDLRHFASSSGGLVVSIDPNTGTVLSPSCSVHAVFAKCISLCII